MSHMTIMYLAKHFWKLSKFTLIDIFRVFTGVVKGSSGPSLFDCITHLLENEKIFHLSGTLFHISDLIIVGLSFETESIMHLV